MFYSLRAAPPLPLINEEVLKVCEFQVYLMQPSQSQYTGLLATPA